MTSFNSIGTRLRVNCRLLEMKLILCVIFAIAFVLASQATPADSRVDEKYLNIFNKPTVVRRSLSNEEESPLEVLEGKGTLCMRAPANNSSSAVRGVTCDYFSGCWSCASACGNLGFGYSCCYGTWCCCYKTPSECNANPNCPYTGC